MAELSPEEQRDLIEAAKSRDQRLALIEQSLDIETELRDSPTWKYLDHRLSLQREEIVAALAKADPASVSEVARLQARAMCIENFTGWLAELIGARGAAEHQIAVEDGRLPADE